MDAQQKVVVAARHQLENARFAGDDRAAVGIARDAVDAGDGARLEVAEQRAPVEGAVERQAQTETFLGDQAVAQPAAGTQLARRHPEDVAACPVELTHASESRGEGDLAHAQVGLVQEPAREVSACGARKAVRRHAEVS